MTKQYKTEETLYQKRVQEFAKKGFVRLATGEKVTGMIYYLDASALVKAYCY